MARNVIFLVHGMGDTAKKTERRPKDWSASLVKVFNDAWLSYPRVKDYPLDAFIDFVPINYDHVFEEYLKSVADAAQNLRQLIPSKKFDKLLEVLESVDDADAGFFWASVGDVLLYRYGADLYRYAHVEVMKQIVDEINKRWDRYGNYDTTFSVVSHSLGTAVANGALNRLGGNPIGNKTIYMVGGQLQFRAYVTLANVSRVLWYGEQEIYRGTVVRPYTPTLGAGYVDTFLNVRHAADPIAAPRRFNPTHWGSGFGSLVVRHLHELNVHGFSHYLRHPRVTGNIFRTVLGEQLITREDIDFAAARFSEIAIKDKSKAESARKILEMIEKKLNEAYGDDKVWSSTVELIGKLGVELIRLRQELQAIGAML